MDLVQWILARPDGSFAVAFAPSWADRMPAPASLGGRSGPALRRRSAPLVSRWLPHPLAIAEVEGEPASAGAPAPAAPGTVALTLTLALEAGASEPAPLLPPGRGELALATLLSEYVSVLGDLLEALSLPLLSLAPDREARGLEVVLGSVGSLSLDKLGEQLCLLRAAVDITAQARGLCVARARCEVDGLGSFELDARLTGRLAEAGARR